MSLGEAQNIIDAYNGLLAKDLAIGVRIWSTVELPATKAKIKEAFKQYGDIWMQRGDATYEGVKASIITPYSYLSAFFGPKTYAKKKKEMVADSSVGGPNPVLADEIAVFLNAWNTMEHHWLPNKMKFRINPLSKAP
jgi:hypothetical protein